MSTYGNAPSTSSRNRQNVFTAFAVALVGAGSIASAASTVVTNYAYDATGNLLGVSQSCSTAGDTAGTFQKRWPRAAPMEPVA
jgi:hypothetical protein